MISDLLRRAGTRTSISAALVRVLTCWLLASGAGWAVSTAITVYAFDRAGAAGAAMIALARLASAAVAAPVAGAALQRLGRTRVVAASCTAQAGCLGAAGSLVLADGSMGTLVVVMAITGAVTSATRPGLQALLAGLSADETQRAAATAAWAALDNAGFLLGTGVAGAAMALSGAAVVCGGAALATTVSAALLLSLPSRTVAAIGAGDAAPPRPDGHRTVRESTSLRVPMLLLTGLMVLEGTTDIQLVAVSHELHLGDGGPGLMFCLWGIGGVLSSVVIRHLVRRRGYGVTMAVGAVGFGVALGLAGLSGGAIALAAMPLVGMGFGVVETGVMGIIPQRCGEEALDRVYGLTEAIYGGAVAVGVVLAPVLITTFGAARSVTMIGATFALITLLGCVFCHNRPRRDSPQIQAYEAP